jgi:Ca2+-binding RTX toxin-like protein
MSSITNPTTPLSQSNNANGGLDIKGFEDQENRLEGTDGKDLIIGGELADEFDGGKGEDDIQGKGGDDFLCGGAGNDTLTGGEGADRFVIGFGFGTETITDFKPGVDRLELTGDLTLENLTYEEKEGNTLVKHKGTGDVFAVLQGVTGFTPNQAIIEPPPQTTVGGDGPDNYKVGEPGSPIDGKNDLVNTGAGPDSVDTSAGQGGNDISTGAGDDKATVGKDDFAFGGEGNDELDASKGRGGNRMYGGIGNDNLTAGKNDEIFGNEGDDTLTMMMKEGGNVAAGGEGKDKFVLDPKMNYDAINKILDFTSGTDKIVLKGINSSDVKYDPATGIISVNGNNLAELDGKPAINPTDDFEFM